MEPVLLAGAREQEEEWEEAREERAVQAPVRTEIVFVQSAVRRFFISRVYPVLL